MIEPLDSRKAERAFPNCLDAALRLEPGDPLMSVLAAEKLEHFAEIVRGIRPPDHRNPHRFHEDKANAVAEMLAEARRLRTMAAPRRDLPVRPVGEIATGTRSVGRREVAVVSRGRRA